MGSLAVPVNRQASIHRLLAASLLPIGPFPAQLAGGHWSAHDPIEPGIGCSSRHVWRFIGLPSWAQDG